MDVKKISEQMSVEEKAKLVNGATFFGMASMEKWNIPRMQLLDGGTGINFEQLFGDMTEVGNFNLSSTNGMVGSTLLKHVIEYYYEPEKLTEEEMGLYTWIKERLENNPARSQYAPGCFPPGILLGATWNKEVVYEVGEALGKEACLYDVDILLGSPNVNIHRDPLNGRLFEGYSEDPCLVSNLAPELVKGVQKYGVAANVKHFAANNQETNRVGINETISARALEEIYFPGFKACVREGGTKTVMSAYNCINGVACTENKWLLTEKLRKEWGFDGVVLSDWGAVYHPAEALAAGNDLAMPGPLPWEPIAEAVQNGKLSENELNLATERLLTLIEWSGQNKQKAITGKDEADILWKQTEEIAYHAACEGIVLVENAGILPLAEGTAVRLEGSGAEKLMECGSGSAGITTSRTSSIKDGLNIAQSDNEDAVVFVCRLGGMEGNDRPHMHLSMEDLKHLYACGALAEEKIPEVVREQLTGVEKRLGVPKPIILVLNVSGPVDLSYINRDVIKAVLVAFLPGMQGGRAIADILTGKINPSGKLPLTFPVKYEDTPTYLNFPGDGYEVCYGEGIYVGYRYYEKKKVRPLYPFGYGLSYSSFICSGLEDIKIADGKISFSAHIRNTSARAGAQVIQIYAGDPYSTLHKPVKELVAFEKVYLQPGEEKQICFEVAVEQLASYDADRKQWITEEGYYDIYAATSADSADVFAQKRVYIDCDSPYSYGMESTVKTICEREELLDALKALWEEKDWDWGIVESNYEYTPSKLIREILPEGSIEEDDQSIVKFIQTVKRVKKM